MIVAHVYGLDGFGATAGCDLYDPRPRKSGDGFDIMSGACFDTARSGLGKTRSA